VFFSEVRKNEKKEKVIRFFRSGLSALLRVQFLGFLFLERAESV